MFMGQAKSQGSTQRTAGEPRSIVIHAKDGWLRSIREDRLDFFSKLIRHATSNGTTTRITTAESPLSKLFLNRHHLNLMVDMPRIQGRNILHVAPSYIPGFWYLDGLGTRARSSLRFAQFCPERIETRKAHWFFNGVTGHMLRENICTQPQPDRLNSPMPKAAVAIFCQDIENDADRSHHLTTEQMLRVTATTLPNEKIYVKPPQKQPKSDRRAIMDLVADYPNICISDASNHDIIAASRTIVTQNSDAGFEALMQKRCVITCAKCDYWHATLTPRTEEDLSEALQYGAEAMADFEYEKFFYWFLDTNCLEPAKEDFSARAWARIADRAFL